VAEKELGSYEEVELRLAEKGTDLWAAVEAAQYARAVTYDDPESEDETAAMTRFVRIFSDYAESWEEVPMNAKVTALDGLTRHLRELGRIGIFVHCGTVERDFAAPGREPKPLPIAVVNLGHTNSPALTVMLPES